MNFWKSFGPGVLFAGAAIGTSHLVQSTRAGAMFGLGLLLVVIATNIVKYPAFRYGPQYAAATGRSLIEGYLGLGFWIVWIYVVIGAIVNSIIIAATAIVTAGIMAAIVGLALDPRYLAIALLVVAAILLFVGGYRFLDRLTKVFVAILAVATFISAALSIPRIEWSLSAFAIPHIDTATFIFMIALMGFMPAGMDLSVIQSLWSVEKSKKDGSHPPLKFAILDFNIGYIGSAGLAVCFLLMGAGVMHAENVVPKIGATPFAAQVIALFTTNLGELPGTVVGVAAFFVMFTTLITVLDGMPRMVARGIELLCRDSAKRGGESDRSPVLIAVTVAMSAGATIVLLYLMNEFQRFIDFVTITAFIVSPLTAMLNHLVMTAKDIPVEYQPSKTLRAWSLSAVVFLALLSVAFLYARFVV